MFSKFFILSLICGIILYVCINYEEFDYKHYLGLVEIFDINMTIPAFRYFINILSLSDNFSRGFQGTPEQLFTAEELKNFNGEDGSQGIYLSILGKVYDVEKGKQHYGPGGNYHYFAGCDGSKAFITGDFTGTSAADDVLSLPSEELVGVNQWVSFYKNEYVYKGKLIGRYYDSNGNPTEYHKELMKAIQVAEEKKRKSDDMERIYPPCNSEWSRDSGTKVWCSKMSGGIKRDWTGVPRMLYSPGSNTYRCACIKDTEDTNIKRNIREYPQCHPQSISCRVYT